MSAPIGHYLHAQNRFRDLIISYGAAVLVLMVFWFGVDGLISMMDFKDTGAIPRGYFLRMISIFGKFMSVNLAFWSFCF